MSKSANRGHVGVGFLGALVLVFIILKLCNVIGWSWWWVLSPLWISAWLAAAFCMMCVVVIYHTRK